MPSDQFGSWLSRVLDEHGWSQRELARRAAISHTTVAQVVLGMRMPTWDFCAAVAHALKLPVDDVFVVAGLKRAGPPAVQEEREVVAILRDLPASVRSTVITMLRGFRTQPSGVAEPPTAYEPADEFTRQLLDEFGELPEEWKPTAIEQVQWVRRLAERPPVRILGEEQDGEAQRQATGTGD